MGNSLHTFDDPNVPSLLSIPLLGYAHYNQSIYEATRARILSRANSWYFEGNALRGLGSPHTPSGHVWPLAMAVQVHSEKRSMNCHPLLEFNCSALQGLDFSLVCMHITR